MHRRIGTLLAVFMAGGAHAQTVALQVAPVSVTMLPGQMAAILRVTDASDSPTTVQVRPFMWRQDDAGDVLTPADDLAVSPPIVPIDANTTQIFRVVLQQPAQGGEAAYRLLIDQLPPPAAAGVVRVVLRLSVPVFAAAAESAPAALGWAVARDGAGDVLVARNTGGRHTRIFDPVLRAADGRAVTLAPARTPYILPGAVLRWAIGTRLPAGTALRLEARTDDGTVSQPLVAP